MLHQYNSNSKSDLSTALELNDINLLYKILDRGQEDINAQDAQGRTALHIAAKLDCSEMFFQALLEEKPNLNLKDHDGDTPLHIAAKRGNTPAVKCLLNAGADRTICNDNFDTPETAAIDKSWNILANVIKNFEKASIQGAKKPLSVPAAIPAVIHAAIPVSVPAPVTNEEAPEEFMCPLTLEIMEDPVVARSGITYERAAIEACIKKNGLDPMAKTVLTVDQLNPNRALKSLIEKWNKAHPSTSNKI